MVRNGKQFLTHIFVENCVNLIFCWYSFYISMFMNLDCAFFFCSLKLILYLYLVHTVYYRKKYIKSLPYNDVSMFIIGCLYFWCNIERLGIFKFWKQNINMNEYMTKSEFNWVNKGNNTITEHRTILQRESQNS